MIKNSESRINLNEVVAQDANTSQNLDEVGEYWGIQIKYYYVFCILGKGSVGKSPYHNV